jgi:hypothetical protein
MNNQDTTSGAPEPITEIPDEAICKLSHAQMLQQPATVRMRWFYLLQVKHRELERVVKDLLELLEDHNDVKIVSIIGMTGVGKTTLATRLLNSLVDRYTADAPAHHHPVIYISAPANGERSLSWKMMYRRILEAGNEPNIDSKRAGWVTPGEMKSHQGTRLSVAHMRELVESMLRHRNVRVLVIDEALHLLRFDAYAAIMDTLKSLADIAPTKLLLIGTHQIADLMIEYGQVARRSEIIHYRRYKVEQEQQETFTEDEAEYIRQLEKFQRNWPCAQVPNLVAIWRPLMRSTLGSIGMTKSTLLRLASLQMSTQGEVLLKTHLNKALKSPSSLRIIEAEAIDGERKLGGACYGDGLVDAGVALELLGPTEAVHA